MFKSINNSHLNSNFKLKNNRFFNIIKETNMELECLKEGDNIDTLLDNITFLLNDKIISWNKSIICLKNIINIVFNTKKKNDNHTIIIDHFFNKINEPGINTFVLNYILIFILEKMNNENKKTQFFIDLDIQLKGYNLGTVPGLSDYFDLIKIA